MPLNVPTLSELRERNATNLELGLPGADAHTPGTGHTEYVNTLVGIAKGLYGNQRWIADQLFVNSMDEAVLVRRAAEVGVTRIAAAFGNGAVDVTGNDGAVVENGDVLQTAAGVLYQATANTAVVAGVAEVPVRALAAGVAGNLTAGTALTFVSTPPGIDSDAVVAAAGITGGADIESIARLRQRFLERRQFPPMGGKLYDYIAWAKQAHVDVTRAFPFEHENGIGSMTVRILTDDLASPIPAQPIIDAVANYMATVRPAGLRNLTVEAPTEVPLNLVFSTLTPNTADVQAAVEAELADLLRREAAPDSTLYLSHIRAAISRAPGVEDYVITLNANVAIAADEFVTVGATTWP